MIDRNLILEKAVVVNRIVEYEEVVKDSDFDESMRGYCKILSIKFDGELNDFVYDIEDIRTNQIIKNVTRNDFIFKVTELPMIKEFDDTKYVLIEYDEHEKLVSICRYSSLIYVFGEVELRADNHQFILLSHELAKFISDSLFSLRPTTTDKYEDEYYLGYTFNGNHITQPFTIDNIVNMVHMYINSGNFKDYDKIICTVIKGN